MNTAYSIKTLVLLAVGVAAVAGFVSQAQDQPMPPPATDGALPSDIAPNTPLAQVVKLVQSGTDVSLIQSFIANSQDPFNLDADKILSLTDLGVPKDIVNAMMDRDKTLYAASVTPPPVAPAPATETIVETAPPPAPVTVNYFSDTLTPYGSWVVVEGYGRCWRPTVVNYDPGWRPYCDRGHWVYTDCGWYWDSDYSWGVTFHYGRWFRNDRHGWCWAPDTEWGPSWVTWRSSSDYCGWAPLPPLAVYRPGAGFFYRGASVSVGFDFGLREDCFTFVPPDRFCEHHPRRFSVEPDRAREVFNHTTIINNYNQTVIHNGGHHRDDTVVVNNGIPVTQVTARTHRPIEAEHVGALPNATRQGWRGDDGDRAGHRGTGANNANNNNPVRNTAFNGDNQHLRNQPNNNTPASPGRNPTINNNNQSIRNQAGQDNGNPAANRHAGFGDGRQSALDNRQSGSPSFTPRQQTVEPPNNRSSPYNRTTPNNNLIINNNNADAQNRSHAARDQQWQQQPQPPAHVNTAALPERSAPPTENRQRNLELLNTAPAFHASPPVERRELIRPSQPAIPERQQRQVEPVIETRQSHVENVPHNSPPAAAAAPAQTEQRNQDRGTDRGSNKDQRDQRNH